MGFLFSIIIGWFYMSENGYANTFIIDL